MTLDRSGWHSELVELLRFGDDANSFDSERPYMFARGRDRIRKFETGVRDDEYRRFLDRLRSLGPAQASDRDRSIEWFSGIVSRILDVEPAARRTQIDLVINAKELASLPFEAANGRDGRPLFVGREPPLELTRRVRGDFREITSHWPAKPNILLIASAYVGAALIDEHKQALRDALKPWIEPLPGYDRVPDERGVLTVCERATLASIVVAVEQAKTPFTHVHILCHGTEVADGQELRYGLELGDESTRQPVGVTAEQLLGALSGGGALPAVVTLTACDSGNVGSRISSAFGVAHALHAAEIPVVVASQFPLTEPGSVVVAKELYDAMLRGFDVREAIHRARVALHGSDGAQHDWMSLVAYVQLPEGYLDRLLDVRMAAGFAALTTAQRWADQVFAADSATPATFDDVAVRMTLCIANLELWQKEANAAGRVDLLVEGRGLLGSAHKRRAELLYRHSALDPGTPGRWIEMCLEDLGLAASWYARAFDDNLSAHWVSVQQLSLEAVLNGRIGEPWRWHAAMYSTRVGPDDGDDAIWKLGSRLELHLLATYAGEQRQLELAQEVLAQFRRRVPPGRRDYVESTARQLRRYIDWWTSANDFFPGACDLSADARALLPGDW